MRGQGISTFIFVITAFIVQLHGLKLEEATPISYNLLNELAHAMLTFDDNFVSDRSRPADQIQKLMHEKIFENAKLYEHIFHGSKIGTYNEKELKRVKRRSLKFGSKIDSESESDTALTGAFGLVPKREYERQSSGVVSLSENAESLRAFLMMHRTVPLRKLYHGTPQSEDAQNIVHSGFHKARINALGIPGAIYFTTSLHHATSYAGVDGRVIEVDAFGHDSSSKELPRCIHHKSDTDVVVVTSTLFVFPRRVYTISEAIEASTSVRRPRMVRHGKSSLNLAALHIDNDT